MDTQMSDAQMSDAQTFSQLEPRSVTSPVKPRGQLIGAVVREAVLPGGDDLAAAPLSDQALEGSSDLSPPYTGACAGENVALVGHRHSPRASGTTPSLRIAFIIKCN